MDWSLTRISTDLDFERDGRQIGDLRLPFSSDDQPAGYHLLFEQVNGAFLRRNQLDG